MGLDISAYARCELIRPRAKGEPYDEALAEQSQILVVSAWADEGNVNEARLDGRPPGYYRCGAEFFWQEESSAHRTYGGFRAGSYGGYSAWRQWLCEQAFNVRPEAVWAQPEPYSDQPFFAIINFTDCDGCIGPETSARLADEFKFDRARICDGEDGAYVRLYDQFAAAFAFAADGGFVVFH